jgi:starch synthase (maltosyl-transferring)
MIRREQPATQSTLDLTRPFAFECITPRVSGGRWAAKRTLGDTVTVAADIFQHGHELLAAAVLYRAPGETAWREAPLAAPDNDRWRGGFVVETLGTYEFTFAAWVQRFAGWQRDTGRKHAAGQDIAADLIEGAALARAAAARAGESSDGRRLRLAASAGIAETLLTAETAEAAERWPDPAARQTADQTWTVLCERERARFGAWYEMFPRSQGTDPARGATFAEAARRLPEIRALGFDVVYLPPIHPIGSTHRKGRNNSLAAAPGDPGSPYAIGAAAGGHDAVEPSLGTLDDFDRFVAACHAEGLEVALDFALNCSPDHPWVRQHPEWFYHRPDGSIKYAENPPKRYEDIYPLNFDGPAAAELAAALRDVLLHWARHGVRIFRVDNPHTKPLPFWEWLLAAVRAEFPDVVFLSEAFTRPKLMKRLAKLGFSQSYTYFTWRNTKHELAEYLTELALGPAREYFRPNFFVNTPDILPEILQRGGRPAFLFRLVLAATLSPSWGMYNGYELCENRAIPGTEEYLDSEKYQYKVWDWNRPGHIKDWITKVNRIRRDHPALQRLEGLRFLRAENPQMLLYARFTPAHDDVLVVAVNLDPFHPQEGPIEIPAPELGLGDAFTVNDLLASPRGTWRGTQHYLKLEPEAPAAILTLQQAQ